MVYVSSDWHGVSYDKIKALLDKAGFCKDDYLFVLGDVIDRGEHGVELIKKIMFEPNIKLIRGNHEQMLISCAFLFDEITYESIRDLNMTKMHLLTVWQSNGAEPTIAGLTKEHTSMREMILEYLMETPLYDTVSVGDRDFLLVHAGIGVHFDGRIKRLSECTDDDLLWSRPSLDTRYSDDFTTIFGHTPTDFYDLSYKGRILKTDTWIDVDTGAARGRMPALLRLDDMQEFYLDD